MQIADNKDHDLTVSWQSGLIKMELDEKSCMNDISYTSGGDGGQGSRRSGSRNSCYVEVSTHNSKYQILNTNGPLHVGGVSFGASEFQKMARAHFKVVE